MQKFIKVLFQRDCGNDHQTDPMWNFTGKHLQNDSNFTNTTQEMEYHFEVFVLVPIMLFGITGNILVCMAVSMEKRLQSVTNYFLLSLAVTDLLLSVIVMPLSMIHQFFGKYYKATWYSLSLSLSPLSLSLSLFYRNPKQHSLLKCPSYLFFL